MAYNVKYRLEFSDDLENGKKIEILKKNYSSSGTVYPIVGTKDPCEISWESNNNFYSAIKGSQCSLNFFVTDTVSYDDFYLFDEREYQVKIYYKDASNNYQLYWIGWLVVDQFKEAITSTPYQIRLTAYDGLGTLDAFDMTLYTDSAGPLSARQWITSTLENLDLDLDIYVSQDIFIRNPGSTTYSLYDVMNINPYALQKSKLDINNAKFVLEQILKITNARIFQSFGRWYIINNSSYSAQSIKNSSASTASGGSVPTGIRAAESASLVANGTESIKYIIYNYQGTYQSTTTVDALLQVPSNLQPIENSLFKEYLRPLKEFNIKHKTSQYLSTNYIQNSGFENGTAGWTTYSSTGTTSPGSISSNFAKQGKKSYQNTQTQTNETGTRKTISKTIDAYNSSHLAYKFLVNAYFDANSNSQNLSFRFKLHLAETGPGATQNYYYKASDQTWTTTDTVNIQDSNSKNTWENFSFDLPTFPITGELTIDLYEPYTQISTGLNGIYYDNIELIYERFENNNRSNFFASIDGFKYQRVRSASDNITGVLDLQNIQLSHNNYANAILSTIKVIRPRDDNANFETTLEKLVTQQVINDYRTHLIRYEGKLYNLQKDPVGLNNKVWINFGSTVLREPVSCYIDSMTYNLKRNTYKVVMHIPNQNDDETSEFKVTF